MGVGREFRQDSVRLKIQKIRDTKYSKRDFELSLVVIELFEQREIEIVIENFSKRPNIEGHGNET